MTVVIIDGLGVSLVFPEGCAVPCLDGDGGFNFIVGITVGAIVIICFDDGFIVANAVGLIVGLTVPALGRAVGWEEGVFEEFDTDLIEGANVGAIVGFLLPLLLPGGKIVAVVFVFVLLVFFVSESTMLVFVVFGNGYFFVALTIKGRLVLLLLVAGISVAL